MIQFFFLIILQGVSRGKGCDTASQCRETNRNNFNGGGTGSPRGDPTTLSTYYEGRRGKEGLGARDQEVECFVCNEIGLWLG